MSLRTSIIRLASANPALRPHLLPLIASTGREADMSVHGYPVPVSLSWWRSNLIRDGKKDPPGWYVSVGGGLNAPTVLVHESPLDDMDSWKEAAVKIMSDASVKKAIREVADEVARAQAAADRYQEFLRDLD